MNVTKFILQDELIKSGAVDRVRKMQILRTGTFTDERYGTFPITKLMLDEMLKNFSEKVRGVIPALDYKHDSDDIAAGWFKRLYVEKELIGDEYSLWADIEMTPNGDKILSDKEFGYVSADFDTNYTDNETGKEYGSVLMGAGLTNRPVIKRMESVITLSQKGSDPISESIKTLITEGKTFDQAVKIAVNQFHGKLSEGEKMNTNKEKELAAPVEKEIDYKAKCAEMEKELAECKKLMEGMIMKPVEKEEEKIEPTEEQAQLASVKKELAEAKKTIELSEKTTTFVKLLSEGKAVEAQREAFISGDMNDFISKAQPIKLSEAGHGGTPAPAPTGDAEKQILELADKLVTEKKISKAAAIAEVLKNNKQLAEKSGY